MQPAAHGLHQWRVSYKVRAKKCGQRGWSVVSRVR